MLTFLATLPDDSGSMRSWYPTPVPDWVRRFRTSLTLSLACEVL